MKTKLIDEIITKSNLNLNEMKKVAQKKAAFITTDNLKKLFSVEAKKHYAQKNNSFEVDENNKNYLNIFCKYFAQDLSFETDHYGDLHKGLYVLGGNGTGKTSSFEILQKISKTYSINQIWTSIICTHDVVREFNLSESTKKDFIIQKYSRGRFMFDDLGAETEASNFGKEDIFIRIMELRYNDFISKGVKTHITSNLTFDDIKKRYGVRVYDRFFEMFNIVKVNGERRR